MSNSKLVSYKQLSPNHSGKRTHKIDTISPHCVVGHLTLRTLGNVFASKAHKASSNYGIDDHGDIGMYVEERNRSWCSSSEANDQRAVTIEIASDISSPYKITDAAMQGLCDLSVDVCRRNDIPELLWKADKSLIGQVDKQNITVHRWFAKRGCPGDYLFDQLGYVADEVNKILLPKKPVVTLSSDDYKVKVAVSSLYYYNKPGTNHLVVGVIRQGEVYTVVDEAFGLGSSKWGKLKSGAGWIALYSCTRVR